MIDLLSNIEVPITLDDQIACMRRKIAMRERNYPIWVAKGKMKEEKAQREIALAKSVLHRLMAEKEKG